MVMNSSSARPTGSSRARRCGNSPAAPRVVRWPVSHRLNLLCWLQRHRRTQPMRSKRAFLPPRTAPETLERVWQHWIGPGAPLDEPVDLLVAPHDVPVWVSTVQARLPRIALTEPDAALIHGSGCGLTRLAAQAAACGEAIERYCASLQPGLPVVRTSVGALGSQCIAPSRFALFAEDQYATPGWHFRRVTPT